MCETLNVSKSGYYDWVGRQPSARQKANEALAVQIQAASTASDKTYGMPRVRAQLRDEGIKASRKRVARLMRQNHWCGVSRRRSYCVTTQRDKRQLPAPDLVNRQFVATDINQLWVADMTYLPTWAGFLYLAVVTDVFSCKVVGWAFGVRMTAELVTQALDMALMTRKPQSVIHHSDQGSQYTSIEFGNRCKQMGVRPSVGSVGDAYADLGFCHSAMAESFFATLECELIDRRVWKTQTDARLAVFSWIEGWYNPKRLHSALGYMSPINFERKHKAQKSTTPPSSTKPPPQHGLTTACFAPVAVDKPAPLIINQGSGSQSSQIQEV